MKKLLIFLGIIFFCCGFFGWKKQPAQIFFSSTPFMENDGKFFQTDFQLGEKIYYLIKNPKGFSDDVLRIQILKKNDKSPAGGFTFALTKDVEVRIRETSFVDDFFLHEKGIYYMQVTEFSNDTKPIAYGIFGIKDE